MAYETNRFCWYGLITPDIDRSTAFYSEVLGQGIMKQPMDGGEITMFTAANVPMAHAMNPPMEGVPPHWNNYLRVDDVDATMALAVKHGGKVVAPGTDIPVGRFAVLSSPSGATISLFHEADEAASEHHPGGLGSVHWVELHSSDISADLKWLQAVFGFETSEMPMPDDTKYYILKDGENMRGGAMAKMFPDAPSMWMTWFEVDDADAAAKRVTNNGGKCFMEPMDMKGVGRMFPAADATGAVFGVIAPERS